ncbi:MAG TPA: hypothetical protein VLX92_08375 [Kofleriaceae bacterium]|nr:hypothetical protein [Kofleriaceae bacterium]
MRHLAFAALLGVAGCITPSIPIPPPDPTEMMFHLTVTDTVSSAVFTYPATQNYKNSVAYVFDRDTGQGVFQDTNVDGSIGPTLPLPAAAGDNVVVTIESGSQTVSTCVVLREGTQDPNAFCQ